MGIVNDLWLVLLISEWPFNWASYLPISSKMLDEVVADYLFDGCSNMPKLQNVLPSTCNSVCILCFFKLDDRMWLILIYEGAI